MGLSDAQTALAPTTVNTSQEHQPARRVAASACTKRSPLGHVKARRSRQSCASTMRHMGPIINYMPIVLVASRPSRRPVGPS